MWGNPHSILDHLRPERGEDPRLKGQLKGKERAGGTVFSKDKNNCSSNRQGWNVTSLPTLQPLYLLCMHLTSYLFMTTAESAAGEAMVFPEFGEGEIKLQVYSASGAFDANNLIGLLNIYPLWWKL